MFCHFAFLRTFWNSFCPSETGCSIVSGGPNKLDMGGKIMSLTLNFELNTLLTSNYICKAYEFDVICLIVSCRHCKNVCETVDFC